MVGFWMFLKVDLTGFPDDSDIEYGVCSQPRMTPRFVSATGKMETPFTYKSVGEADFWKESGVQVWAYLRCSAGDWGRGLGSSACGWYLTLQHGSKSGEKS